MHVATERDREEDTLRERILGAVRQYWGYESLRPLQHEAIAAGLDQRDSLVVMPTGGGKSLCYQVPPIVAERTDVVVSPLISLMKDQVDGLRACGYPAAAVHSNLDPRERREVEEGMREGRYRLIFTSPERLVTSGFQAMLQRMEVRAFAIDEAHCISHWGHDFRPEYRQLAGLKERFPGSSLHAFTATATPRVQRDIVDQLALDEANVLVGSPDRPNLVYRIVPRTAPAAQVLEVIRRHPGEAVIVYCMTRKETEGLAATLASKGISARAYHAGMERGERKTIQEAFAREDIDVVVATVAFGMGIDRSDVRCVVHASMPKSIEHYQQETGRAGRDGLEAECVLLYSAADWLRWKGLVERSAAERREYMEMEGGGIPEGEENAPDEVVAAQLELLRHMQGMCGTLACRHRTLVRYFGGAYDRERCDACDVCLGEVEPMDESTVVAQKILSCVARLDQRWGVGRVVEVLRGAETDGVRSSGHHHLSTFGLLADVPAKSITNLVYQLVDHGLLERTPGDRPVLRLTGDALPVLRGEREIGLVRPHTAAAVRKTRTEEASWDGVDKGLFEHLRGIRLALARERGVPPYVLFSDRVLRELARSRPTSLEAMAGLWGVGAKKLDDLGPTFTEEIATYCRGTGVATDIDAAPA